MNAQTNITNRRLLNPAAELGLLAAITLVVLGQLSGSNPAKAPGESEGNQPVVKTNPLKPPAQGSIPVAFLISEGAQMIDFAGPWEVFQDVRVPERADQPFRLYTVSESTSPIHASGGMKIVPDYKFENAPAPKVIVIPAQSAPSQATLEWIRKSTKNTDVTMSVCTGAFVLAKTGLLSGKAATTYHGAFGRFAMEFPDIQLKRGARFVENGNLATAGGLSSGIDLALRVVDRYYGREVAQRTAYDLEYQGQGWMNPESNQLYATAPVSTAEHPLCVVCGMDVDPKRAPKSIFKGTTYYFCSDDDKKTFDAAPDKFVNTDRKSL
ncbi:MAG TPA: DJ-1/PfpI family protein [Candidatus Udaeobacter sp.]|jgi:putative intracellular protease/amidase/YHS domain-containing protein|nr:DJ-1/PfpI family protein [Candidatus Udaeobacter sp.]